MEKFKLRAINEKTTIGIIITRNEVNLFCAPSKDKFLNAPKMKIGKKINESILVNSASEYNNILTRYPYTSLELTRK